MGDKIIDALERSNKWWKEEFIIAFKPREVYDKIKKFLPTRQIISLTGLRRTGKTTIMLKIVHDFLSTMNKRNIVYFSFDDFREIRLSDVVKNYARLINKEINKEAYLFLFDEIQKVEGWE